MKKILRSLMFLLIATFLIGGAANATLLNLPENRWPDIFSDTSGIYTYDADTNILTITSRAQTIMYTSDVGSLSPIYDGSGLLYGWYTAQFLVDGSGNFAGNSGGLLIEGSLTSGVGTKQTLLQGNITNFGWTYNEGKPIFDYVFEVTGGSLESYFLNGYGYSYSTIGITTWDGSWGEDKNHSGSKVKTDTVPVPEPSTLMLLGSGLVGLGLYRWRRTKM